MAWARLQNDCLPGLGRLVSFLVGKGNVFAGKPPKNTRSMSLLSLLTSAYQIAVAGQSLAVLPPRMHVCKPSLSIAPDAWAMAVGDASLKGIGPRIQFSSLELQLRRPTCR